MNKGVLGTQFVIVFGGLWGGLLVFSNSCDGECQNVNWFSKMGRGGVLFFLRRVLFVQEYLVVTRLVNIVGIAEL